LSKGAYFELTFKKQLSLPVPEFGFFLRCPAAMAFFVFGDESVEHALDVGLACFPQMFLERYVLDEVVENCEGVRCLNVVQKIALLVLG
jgi:hypothetical protein